MKLVFKRADIVDAGFDLIEVGDKLKVTKELEPADKRQSV